MISLSLLLALKFKNVFKTCHNWEIFKNQDSCASENIPGLGIKLNLPIFLLRQNGRIRGFEFHRTQSYFSNCGFQLRSPARRLRISSADPMESWLHILGWHWRAGDLQAAQAGILLLLVFQFVHILLSFALVAVISTLRLRFHSPRLPCFMEIAGICHLYWSWCTAPGCCVEHNQKSFMKSSCHWRAEGELCGPCLSNSRRRQPRRRTSRDW